MSQAFPYGSYIYYIYTLIVHCLFYMELVSVRSFADVVTGNLFFFAKQYQTKQLSYLRAYIQLSLAVRKHKHQVKPSLSVSCALESLKGIFYIDDLFIALNTTFITKVQCILLLYFSPRATISKNFLIFSQQKVLGRMLLSLPLSLLALPHACTNVYTHISNAQLLMYYCYLQLIKSLLRFFSGITMIAWIFPSV